MEDGFCNEIEIDMRRENLNNAFIPFEIKCRNDLKFGDVLFTVANIYLGS